MTYRRPLGYFDRNGSFSAISCHSSSESEKKSTPDVGKLAQMLILFILARIICSISADRSDTVSVSDLIINASETPWQYTEGYEMTEDEMMVENKLVLARWGVTDFTSLSKRSPRADAVCVALNGKLFYDFYAYKFRSARCTYPGRSPLFAVKCGTWKRNAVILPSRPETDTINLGRCPNYTVGKWSWDCKTNA